MIDGQMCTRPATHRSACLQLLVRLCSRLLDDARHSVPQHVHVLKPADRHSIRQDLRGGRSSSPCRHGDLGGLIAEGM